MTAEQQDWKSPQLNEVQKWLYEFWDYVIKINGIRKTKNDDWIAQVFIHFSWVQQTSFFYNKDDDPMAMAMWWFKDNTQMQIPSKFTWESDDQAVIWEDVEKLLSWNRNAFERILFVIIEWGEVYWLNHKIREEIFGVLKQQLWKKDFEKLKSEVEALVAKAFSNRELIEVLKKRANESKSSQRKKINRIVEWLRKWKAVDDYPAKKINSIFLLWSWNGNQKIGIALGAKKAEFCKKFWVTKDFEIKF